jgi:uncharacterized protein YjdB
MTRSTDVYIGSTQSDSLRQRTAIAKNNGSDLFVSIHNNSAANTSANGAEIIIPRYFYNSELTVFGKDVLSNITSATGIANRGVVTRDCTNNELYTLDANGRPNGIVSAGEAGYSTYSSRRSQLLADYYGVINGSVTKQIPGCIIEHAFISNASDRAKLTNQTYLKALGEADAKAIIKYFETGVKENDSVNSIDPPTITTTKIGVAYKPHVQSYGWTKWYKNGKTAGTTGESKRIEALAIYPYNMPDGATITAKAHIQSYGWREYTITSEGGIIGTTGESKRIEAVSFTLNDVPGYVIEYRVHCQTFGWTKWYSQGETAGTTGLSKRIEAIEMRIVASNKLTKNDDTATASHVTYSTHVQTYGWQGFVADGATSGTSGQSKRLEAIRISLYNQKYSGGITYRVHSQTYGWMKWVKNGTLAGTVGQSKRLEAIQIKLTGKMAKYYDVEYRVHCQTYGWMPWVKNGAIAGTTGQSKRLEAIQIRLVPKD